METAPVRAREYLVTFMFRESAMVPSYPSRVVVEQAWTAADAVTQVQIRYQASLELRVTNVAPFERF
jgi:hypothetical protein